jgi:hypothetical protein
VELTLIIFSREAYRERAVKWEVLTQAYGSTMAFSRRHQHTAIPDIFDHIHADIQEPTNAHYLLVENYDIERRFSYIRQHYELFLSLSQWFQFLKKYLPPGCALEADLFTFIQQSTTYFQEATQAPAVLLKLLYRFAQLEGLPVRQDWLATQKDSGEIQAILHQPLASLKPGQVMRLESITSQLHQWILPYSGHARTSPFQSHEEFSIPTRSQ